MAIATPALSVYREELLVRIGASTHPAARRRTAYARLLDRSKSTVMDGATGSTKSVSQGAQQASAAAVGSGAQAWEKLHFPTEAQTRDLWWARIPLRGCLRSRESWLQQSAKLNMRAGSRRTDGSPQECRGGNRDGKEGDQDRLRVQLTASSPASETIKSQNGRAKGAP
jgi:hypothetical protein